MDAFVSGQAGIAAILEEDRIIVRPVDAPNEAHLGSIGELSHLFQGCTDLIFKEDVSENEILSLLDESYRVDRTLRLSLIALDVNEELEIRTDALEAMGSFLQDTRSIAEVLRQNAGIQRLLKNQDGLKYANDDLHRDLYKILLSVCSCYTDNIAPELYSDETNAALDLKSAAAGDERSETTFNNVDEMEGTAQRPLYSTRRIFGTDGIRGTANHEPMTAETALKVGMAAGCQFRRGRHQHRVLIGKDTRLSGYMLEAALTAGFIAVGMDVIIVGPIPTPAVAILTRSMRCDLGVMLSASHNPFQDNGIKLFGPDGFKLSDEVENLIQGSLGESLRKHLVAPSQIGRAKRLEDAQGRYIEFVKHSFPKGCTLAGMRIVLDCANGAAYKVAPEILWELGAEVIPIGVSPDGTNINRECGSTSPEAMCRAVQDYRADFGLALDGDADRVLIADENGMLIDGDQAIAVIANHWRTSGQLKMGGVVATVMSNMGLERYLSGIGLTLERSKVGDRYVVEHMRRKGFNVGGEQSGHIILSDYTTTGDGLIAALQVLAVIISCGQRPSQVCRVFEPLPQLLRNVHFEAGAPLESSRVKMAIEEGERRLGSRGRVLIRSSGTEPVIRVMAEGEDEGLVGAVIDDICSAIRATAA